MNNGEKSALVELHATVGNSFYSAFVFVGWRILRVMNKTPASSAQVVLEAQHLIFNYKDPACRALSDEGDAFQKPVVEDVSFSLKLGSLLGIVGPNGGGKSTLLKLLVGLLTPCSGVVSHSCPLKEVGYLPQRTEVDRNFPLRVVDVVAMGLWAKTGNLKRLSKEDYEMRVLPALEKVGLMGYEARGLHCLSGGQFQRLLFARLLVQEASLLFLDEPFNALDPQTMEDLSALLVSLQEQGKTIVVVSHQLDSVRQFFPLTLILAKKMIAFGETKDVLTEHNLSKAVSIL